MSNLVFCPICGQTMKWITTNHLKFKHGISGEEFRRMYPNFQRCSDSVLDNKRELVRIMNQANKSSDKWLNSRWSEENRQAQSEKFKELRQKMELDPYFVESRNSISSKIMQDYWIRYYKDKEFQHSQKALRSERMKQLWKDPKFRERYHDQYSKGRVARSRAMRLRWKDPEYQEFIRQVLLNSWKDPEYRKNQAKYTDLRLNANKYRRYEYCSDSHKLILKSSYEVKCAEFLDYFNFDYDYENLRIMYSVGNESHTYIPDFYLPQFNLILEVKPKYLISDLYNQAKMIACELSGYTFMFVTEEELISSEVFHTALFQFISSTTIESVE